MPALVAVATSALSAYAWFGRLTAHIAGVRAGLPLERSRRRVVRRRHPHPGGGRAAAAARPEATHAAGVQPPVWIAFPPDAGRADGTCRDADRAGHTSPGTERTRGTSPGTHQAGHTSPAPERGGDVGLLARFARFLGGRERAAGGYRLCIARHRAGDASVILAFSDGTTRSWHPAARVVARPFTDEEPRAGSPGRRRVTAAVLEPLVRDISRNGDTPLESVIKNHSEEYPEWAVQHAVQAAVLWGLLAAADARDARRLYALLGEPDPAEAAGIALTITPAGRVWLDGHPHRGARPGRRSRRGPVRIDGDVLLAVAELLRIAEVWERPGLRQARDTLTTAVTGGPADPPAVRSAVDQVLTLAGGLVLGVAGTGAYDVLRGFAA